MRPLIAIGKLLALALVCLLTLISQAFVLLIPGNKRFFYVVPTLFCRAMCFIFRIKVRTQGNIAEGRVMYVGNHLSYIDIPVLGSVLKASFISKASVRKWPVFGWLASMGKTIYIERTRSAAAKAIQDIEKSLSQGRSLILFPEGTSTKGIEVLPFKSTVFELFLNDELKNDLIVQPFTLTLQGINTHKPPVDIKAHDIYAWYGDMELEPHMWALALSKGVDILITFHSPIKAADHTDRKVFAKECHTLTAQGLVNTLATPLISA